MNKRQAKKNYKKLYVELENKYYELLADHTRVCLELEELKAKANKPKATRKKKVETEVEE